ncbi:MAG: STAS domain-containing protein [Chloroflexota bacterium]
MEITTSQMQGRVSVTVLQVSGTVDSSAFQDFTNAMRSAIEDGAKYLLIDISGVPFMSSAGIRSLNEIALLLRKKFPQEKVGWTPKSTRLKLLKPSARVEDVLKISGVDSTLEIFDELEKAIASF